MPSRRQVLTGTALLLTTGCLSNDTRNAPTVESSEPSPGDGTARSTGESMTRTPECDGGFSVTADEFAPVEQLPIPLDPSQRAVVEAAIAEDGTTVETYRSASLRTEGYVEFDGRYHRIEYEQTGETAVPARELNVAWETGQQAPDDATVVGYDELPADDRRALDLAINPEEAAGERGEESDGHPSQRLEVGSYPAPYPDGTADSLLASRETTWVEWDGRVYEVQVGGEATATRRTFEYRVTEVAASDEAFREHVVDRRLVVLEDLRESERAVLESALEGGYRECEPASAGLERLRNRLDEDGEPRRLTNLERYVEYDGRRYHLAIFRWVV